MNPKDALMIIDAMKDWTIKQNLSLIIVGSVGYRSALIHPENFENCDDIDCIFIYNDIKQISGCPIVGDSFFQTACDTIPGRSDMFTVKAERNGIRLSADFVSSKYLHALADEEITGETKYRLKLTNAIEVPDNEYRNFYGDKTVYRKTWISYQNYRIYRLPIHYFVNGVFFPGVLFSKYIFNPTSIVLNNDHQNDINMIQCRMKAYCPPDGSLLCAYRKASSFSSETKAFLYVPHSHKSCL